MDTTGNENLYLSSVVALESTGIELQSRHPLHGNLLLFYVRRTEHVSKVHVLYVILCSLRPSADLDIVNLTAPADSEDSVPFDLVLIPHFE